MALSHTIQTQEDIYPMKSHNLQLIIQTQDQISLSDFDCQHLSVSVEGFLGFDKFSQLFQSLAHLQLQSFNFKYGVSNKFSDADAQSLSEFLKQQKQLNTLHLMFDQNNPVYNISPILNVIGQEIKTLDHLILSFDDEVKINLQELSFITTKKLQTLQLFFGQEVCLNQNWTNFNFQQENTELKEFTLQISPFNRLDQSFSYFFGWLKNQVKLQKVELIFSSQLNINETAFLGLGQALQNMNQLKNLTLFIHDTRNLTQEAFNCIVDAFHQLENLNLDLGNNYGIKEYTKLYESIKNIKNVKLNFGFHHKFISQQLFEGCCIKTLDITMQKGSEVKAGSFSNINSYLQNAETLNIKLSNGKDLADDDLIELAGQITPNSDIKVKTDFKTLRKYQQTLFLQLENVPSFKSLFTKLRSQLDQLVNLKIFIKYTSIDQESIDQIITQLQNTKLKVLCLTFKKINNFICNQLIDLFQQILSVRQWTFLSLEVLQKCILQLYCKTPINQQVNIQLTSGLKLGTLGLELISKSIKLISVTKFRLTILSDNQVNEAGFKLITMALLQSSNLQKVTFQVVEQNTQFQNYLNKMQGTVNQYIKDKSKIQKSYCQILARESEKNSNKISSQQLNGIVDYLIEDVQLPAITSGQQYHNSQVGLGSGLNPQQIIDIFSL